MKFAHAFLAAAMVLSSFVAHGESAAAFPSKTIRILVSFTPGGPTDLLARGLARQFSKDWKQPVIVENRPGADGLVALEVAKASPPDGYTLVVHSDGYAIAPAIYRKLPYDPIKDFTPAALLARAPNVLVVADNGKYATMADLIRRGQQRNGAVSYASAGVGSAQHMQAAEFSMETGLNNPVHVPFKGTPEALNEVMAGRVDFVFAPMANVVQLLVPGKLRALAVSTRQRSPVLPNVPTVAEQGYPKFAAAQWWGLFVPSKVPSDITQKIEDETRKALATPDMKKLIADLGSTEGDVYGADFAAQIREQIAANKRAAVLFKIPPQ